MNGPCRFAEALFLRPTVTQIYMEVLSFHNVSVDGDGDDAPGDELAACLQRVCRRPFKSAAAGNFHPHDDKFLDVVLREDGRQLLGVVSLVQLGAADDRDASTHQVAVEVGVCVGRAVCGDEQFCAVEPRSLDGNELYLHGPLGKLRVESCKLRV